MWSPFHIFLKIQYAWQAFYNLHKQITISSELFWSKMSDLTTGCLIKKRPTLVYQFPQPPWQLSSKVSGLWPCSVHAIGENVITFKSWITFEWFITRIVTSSLYRLNNFQYKVKYSYQFWFLGLCVNVYLYISDLLSARN